MLSPPHFVHFKPGSEVRPTNPILSTGIMENPNRTHIYDMKSRATTMPPQKSHVHIRPHGPLESPIFHKYGASS